MSKIYGTLRGKQSGPTEGLGKSEETPKGVVEVKDNEYQLCS